MNLFTGLSDGGYHRCRRSGIGDLPLLLENLKVPTPDFMIDGSYPSLSLRLDHGHDAIKNQKG